MIRAIAIACMLLVSAASGAEPFWIDELDLREVSQDWGSPQARKSVDGHRLKIGKKEFERGIGTHANGSIVIELNGAAEAFDAELGIDAEMGRLGSSVFRVLLDGKMAVETGILRGGEAPVSIHADLRGVKRLELLVGNAGDSIDYDHADWADARLTLAPAAATRPRIVSLISNEKPKIASTIAPPEPRIHGPLVVGTTPGRPFVFLVPATGQAPLAYSADGLPEGLSIDGNTGVISGSTTSAGESPVTLRVTGPAGRYVRKLTILAGQHNLALTPPMGWNSWNVWGTSVDAAKIRAAADAFASSGLASHGYSYINIDDAWEGTRDEQGNIRTNDKFGDMKVLADYVHARGLKLGIYSSPGPKTCAGYEGSSNHEEQDAKTWASWGIDYLKYDWCSCKSKDPRAPYALMRRALDNADRDIVYSLCQYGRADVWKWAPGDDVRGNLWRTTGDITDTWSSLSTIGFAQPRISSFASPGHWNDPDMLVVGQLGWGEHPRPTRLKPIEQQTHITMWCMLAAPLLIGCDWTRLDDFTRDLLCNDEVIEIDQDPLGKAATVVKKDGEIEVWSRPLYDDAIAIAIFNRGTQPAQVRLDRFELGIQGRIFLRDLWQQTDLGAFDRPREFAVPAHGSVLLKLTRPS